MFQALSQSMSDTNLPGPPSLPDGAASSGGRVAAGDVDAQVAEVLRDLLSCSGPERASRFEFLVSLLGPVVAGRLWLAAFSGSDASET